ncbi:MAG: chaperone modulator CbpM [Scytonema hyalinum WJT4-NPBG1]|jgi:MerR family transcriptional regulator/heat shock protein HspR/chaperone modulatory protein CbpM|nr:chaperone modulator CbpM [Scytonema hyalinum WJT4-NPBG1]
MNQMSLSRVVVSRDGERLVTFEQAAHLTQTSITILERFAALGLIEPVESMLRLSELTRVVQVMRLRRDLGLNLVGAAMVLDMAQEINQLRAQLQVLRRQRF